MKIDDFFDLHKINFIDLFRNIDNPWEVIPKIENYINNLFIKGSIKSNFKASNNIFIGKGTIIEEGVKIIGPAVIGKDCFISHSSYLREGCLLGDNVHIGHAVEIKNSVFFNNSVAAHLNYIGDSIIGNNVNISGGVILANLRLDKKSIKIKMGNKIVDTKLKKLGSVIGDSSIIGVNSVLNPGVIMEKECVVFPLTSVTGFHKKTSLIK